MAIRKKPKQIDLTSKFITILIFILLFISFQDFISFNPVEGEVKEDADGNLLIDGGSVHTIDMQGGTYQMQGNITVDGSGSKLIIRNTTLKFLKGTGFRYKMEVKNGGTVLAEDSTITIDTSAGGSEEHINFIISNSNFVSENTSFLLPGNFEASSSNITFNSSFIGENNQAIIDYSLIFNLTDSIVLFADSTIEDFKSGEDIYLRGSTMFTAIESALNLSITNNLMVFDSSKAMLYSIDTKDKNKNGVISIQNSGASAEIFRLLSLTVTDSTNIPVGGARVTPRNYSDQKKAKLPYQPILDYLSKTIADYNVTDYLGEVILPLRSDNITFTGIEYTGNYLLELSISTYTKSGGFSAKPFPNFYGIYNNPELELKFGAVIPPDVNKHYSNALLPLKITGSVNFNSPLQLQQSLIVDGGTLTIQATTMEINQTASNRFFVQVKNGGKLILLNSELSDPGKWPLNIYVQDGSEFIVRTSTLGLGHGILSLRSGSALIMNATSMTGSINSEGPGNMISALESTMISASDITLQDSNVEFRDVEISTDTITTAQLMFTAVNTSFNQKLTFESNTQANLTNVSFQGVSGDTIIIKDTSEVYIFWWLTVKVVDGGNNLLEKATVHVYNFTLGGKKILYGERDTGVDGQAVFDVYSEKRNASGSFKGIERNYFVNASYRTSVSNDVGTLPPISNKLIKLEFDLAADLTLTSPVITGNLFAGNLLVINATIMNIGDFDLNTTEIPVRFLVDDKILDPDSKLSKLGVNENANVTKEWTATLGTHIVNITVDPTNVIGEKNETNNLVTKIISISVTGPNPGLSASDITFDPPVPTKNTNMTVSARITNFGGYDPADNGDVVSVKFYLNDPLLGGTQVGTTQTIESIPPTTTRTVEINFTITMEGNYNIFVIVEAPYDSDLTNNKANRTLIIYTLPDLYISSSDIKFIPSSKPIHESPVFIRAVIHNIGGTAVDNVGVAFYDGDPDNGGVRIGFNTTIDPIEPNGGTVAAQIEWTPVLIGEHQIFVVIDPDGLLTEAKVSNNMANWTVDVLSKPNLRVEPLDIIFSSNPIMEGDQLNIQVLVHNDGDVAVNFVTVRVTLNSLESTPIVSDIQIISIPANGYFNVPITWQKAEPNGTHTFYVRVDPDNKIPESNKLDNHAGRQLIITKTIDLVVNGDDISIDNDSVTNQIDYGKSVTVTARIWNEGGTPTVTDFIVQIFISNDVTDLQLGSDQTISLIEAGSYVDVSVSWNVNASGRHEITVLVDPSGLVFDSNRANNKAMKEIFVSGPPDLAVVVDENMFSTGGYAKAGESLTINAFVQNRGETGWGPVVVSFHVGDPTDALSGSVIIGNPVIIAYLGPSAQQAVNITWTATVEGEYEIYVAIDLAEDVPDTNRENNIASGMVEVLKDAPDFRVDTIDINPEEVKVGQEVFVNITIRNLGNIFASGVIVGIYEYDETNEDNMIYNYTVINIAKNGTHRHPFIWNGTNLPLTYELIVVVDPYNDFKEFDESNNKLSIEIPVEPELKDAELEFLPNAPIEIIPLEPEEGDTVSITVYFKNVGGKTAKNIVITLTLGGKVIAMDQSVGDLAGGDTGFSILTWKPDSKGSYLIKVELSSEDGVDSVTLDYVVEVSADKSSGSSDNAMVAGAIASVVLIVILAVFVLLLVGSKRRITEWAECSECSAKMPMEASVCPTCGVEFSDEMECGECHSIISIDDSTCPNCGAVFIEDAEREDKKKRGFLKFGEQASEDEPELEEPEPEIETDEELDNELGIAKVPPTTEAAAAKSKEEKEKEKSSAGSEDDEEGALKKGKEEDIEMKIDEDFEEEGEIELDEEEFEEFEKALDSDHIEDMEPSPLMDRMDVDDDIDKKKKKKKKKKESDAQENGPAASKKAGKTGEDKGVGNNKAGDNQVSNASANAAGETKEADDRDKEDDKSKDDKEDDFIIPEAQWTAECYKCNARIPLSASICPECGAEFE